MSRDHPRGTSYTYYYYTYFKDGFGCTFSYHNSDTTLTLDGIGLYCTSKITIADSIIMCKSTYDQVIKILGEPTFTGGIPGHPELVYRLGGKKKWQFRFEFDDKILHSVSINTWQ